MLSLLVSHKINWDLTLIRNLQNSNPNMGTTPGGLNTHKTKISKKQINQRRCTAKFDLPESYPRN